MQDTLVAFSTLSDQPEVAWTLDCGFGYEISPSASSEGDEIVYIPTDKGVIYAVDGRDVSVIWAHKISNALINNIVPLGNQEVVAASMDGRIVRLKFTGR
jgi:outer membrane protein assembly factor BamB